MNIIFTGYRCTGKTSAGRRLAQHLGCAFYDADEMIIKLTGRSVEQIVAEKGWPAFREVERTVILELSGKDNCVIAPGGGAVLDERNVETLKKNGLFVWLVADTATIVQRLKKDQTGGAPRPSLSGKPVEMEVQEILAQREPIYRHIADLTIDTSTRTVEEVVKTIAKKLKRGDTGLTLHPSLVGRLVEREVQTILAQREPIYRHIADLITETSAQSAEEVAALIVRRLGQDQADQVAAAILDGLGKHPNRNGLVGRKEG
ncbi:MAG: shikimate kinase [Syntrophales bacterium]|nr:shikimate kinase [Syntrophales bacterium]